MGSTHTTTFWPSTWLRTLRIGSNEGYGLALLLAQCLDLEDFTYAADPTLQSTYEDWYITAYNIHITNQYTTTPQRPIWSPCTRICAAFATRIWTATFIPTNGRSALLSWPGAICGRSRNMERSQTRMFLSAASSSCPFSRLNTLFQTGVEVRIRTIPKATNCRYHSGFSTPCQPT